MSRFDGQHWTTYATADGLPTDFVTAIAVAPEGAVWFGTQSELGERARRPVPLRWRDLDDLRAAATWEDFYYNLVQSHKSLRLPATDTASRK